MLIEEDGRNVVFRAYAVLKLLLLTQRTAGKNVASVKSDMRACGHCARWAAPPSVWTCRRSWRRPPRARTQRDEVVTDEAIAVSRRGPAPGRRAARPGWRRPPGTGGTRSAWCRRARSLGRTAYSWDITFRS